MIQYFSNHKSAIEEYELMFECIGFKFPKSSFVSNVLCLKYMISFWKIMSAPADERPRRSLEFAFKAFPNIFDSTNINFITPQELKNISVMFSQILLNTFDNAKSYMMYFPGPNLYLSCIISWILAYIVSYEKPSAVMDIYATMFAFFASLSVTTPFNDYFYNSATGCYKRFLNELDLLDNVHDDDIYYTLSLSSSLYILGMGYITLGDNFRTNHYFRQCLRHMDKFGIGESESSHIVRTLYLHYCMSIQGKILESTELSEYMLQKCKALDEEGISTTESYIFLAACHIQAESDPDIIKDCLAKGLSKEADIIKMVICHDVIYRTLELIYAIFY